MKCAICGESFNDGVQCGACKKHLDFSCANISEAGYRKLGSERRSAWKCPQCRLSVSSPVPQKDSTMLETILNELQEVKRQLSSLPTLIEDIKTIKRELSDLKASCEFNSAKLDEQAKRISDLEYKMAETTNMRSSLDSSANEIATLRKELAAKDQWTRLNNIEVKGVPLKSGENLFSVTEALTKAVGYTFSKSQINYIARVPVHNAKDKSIVINFINRYVKEEFIAAARKKKHLVAADIGFSGNTQRVFVNDHLTPEYKNLLTKTKSVAKEKDFSYVWVKYCKIHVRKNDTSRVLIISSESDLNKMA